MPSFALAIRSWRNTLPSWGWQTFFRKQRNNTFVEMRRKYNSTCLFLERCFFLFLRRSFFLLNRKLSKKIRKNMHSLKTLCPRISALLISNILTKHRISPKILSKTSRIFTVSHSSIKFEYEFFLFFGEFWGERIRTSEC